MSEPAPRAETVGDLIQVLLEFDPSSKVFTIAPSFAGVRCIRQESGAILIAPTRSDHFVHPITGETDAA